jgi:hypothetical protein
MFGLLPGSSAGAWVGCPGSLGCGGGGDGIGDGVGGGVAGLAGWSGMEFETPLPLKTSRAAEGLLLVRVAQPAPPVIGRAPFEAASRAWRNW